MIKESQGAVWDPTAHPEPRHPDWDWELAPLPHPQEPVRHVASPETQPRRPQEKADLRDERNLAPELN